jgi:hypothetical protein
LAADRQVKEGADMPTRRPRWPLGRTVAAIAAALIATTLGGTAAASSQVVQDPGQFTATTGAVAVPFPVDADTALPSRPFAGLVGHSCTGAATGIDLGEVTIAAPAAGKWICYVDADWNAPVGNIAPRPTSPTIIADGEDDFVLTFESPVNALGLGLLTNNLAQERITVTADDGSTTVFEDAALGTAPNSFEFVGFTSPEGIRAVKIDTAGGRFQNTGITSIAIGHTPPVTQVAIDIKPGSVQNCVNPRAAGVVPVAVLSDDDFDAHAVNASTVALEGAPARPRGRSGQVGTLQDVDGDGDVDLLVQINDPSVLAGKSEALLTGTTWDGAAIEGSDRVCTVG